MIWICKNCHLDYARELKDKIPGLEKFAAAITCSEALKVCKDVDEKVTVIFNDDDAPTAPDTMELLRDEERRKDNILLARVGGPIPATYCHSTKTITFYTKNIGLRFEDYLSVFAHTYFYAIHEFLLDVHGNTEPKIKYYHEVVMDSMATYFTIEFLKSDGNSAMAQEIVDSFKRRYHDKVIYNPYAGYKYFYKNANDSRCNVDFCGVLKASFVSFADALKLLVKDGWEYDVIIKKKTIRIIDNRPVSLEEELGKMGKGWFILKYAEDNGIAVGTSLNYGEPGAMNTRISAYNRTKVYHKEIIENIKLDGIKAGVSAGDPVLDSVEIGNILGKI